MNVDNFWEIIDRVKDIAHPDQALKNELRLLSLDEIISFSEHFDVFVNKAYTWLMWSAAYIIGGGCSDDGFTDFRYGLISLGKDVYYKAVENPDSLVELDDDIEIRNESFGYVAFEIHEENAGSEMPDSSITFEPLDMGEDWDFDDVGECSKRLPKLTKLHYE